MSVRGEYRRMLGELLAALDEAGSAFGAPAAALAPLHERAGDDLTAAAEATLALLGQLEASAVGDTALRHRLEDARERLDAVCRIVLGRPPH